MAKKVIFADNILRAKGIEKAKFDTSKLNELVEKFFLDHDAKEKILLRSQRFIEMENPPDLVNCGSGREVTIRQLAEMIQEMTGCKSIITWDRTKPDGTPRKLCDTSLIRSLGWSPKIDLATGLRRTVDEYRVALATGNIRL